MHFYIAHRAAREMALRYLDSSLIRRLCLLGLLFVPPFTNAASPSTPASAPAASLPSSPSCVFSTPAGTFDLAPLGALRADSPQDGGATWSALFGACADLDASAASGLCGSAAPAPAPALLAESGACYALGRLAQRSVAPLVANSSGRRRVGVTVAFSGGDACGDGALARSVSINIVCADVARASAVRVAEGAAGRACAIAASVESRAGCPLECARDAATGAVCGGESRGVCSAGAAATGGAAACVCASGFSGSACAADAAFVSGLLAAISSLLPQAHLIIALAVGAALLLISLGSLLRCRLQRPRADSSHGASTTSAPARAGARCCTGRFRDLKASICGTLSSAHFRVCAALALLSLLSVTLPSVPRKQDAGVRQPSVRLSAEEAALARAEALFLDGTQVPEWVSTLRREGGAAALVAEAEAKAALPENSRWTAITAASNEYATMSHSQDREDVWAFERFFWQKRGGVVLESGAEDGLHASNSLFLQNFLLWHSILIEPGPTNFELLKRNREDGCLLLHAAICDR